jgi:hypothetical protein
MKQISTIFFPYDLHAFLSCIFFAQLWLQLIVNMFLLMLWWVNIAIRSNKKSNGS